MKKTMIRQFAWATLPLAATFVVGCSGDDTGSDDDNTCTGHGCTTTMVNLESDEAGEVRWEYMTFPGGTEAARLTTYFRKSQNPAHFTVPEPGNCITYKDKNDTWPLANPATVEALDVGTVTLEGAPTPTTVSPQMDVVDPFYRPHDVAYTSFVQDNVSSLITPSTEYDVKLGGNADFGGYTFEGAVRVPAAYDPPPLMESDFVSIPAGLDFTIDWTAPTEQTDDAIIPFLLFADENGVTTHTCIGDIGSNSITVPAAILTETSTGGFLLHAQSIHRVVPMVDADGAETDKRVDMLGLWCHLRAYGISTQ